MQRDLRWNRHTGLWHYFEDGTCLDQSPHWRIVGPWFVWGKRRNGTQVGSVLLATAPEKLAPAQDFPYTPGQDYEGQDWLVTPSDLHGRVSLEGADPLVLLETPHGIRHFYRFASALPAEALVRISRKERGADVRFRLPPGVA